MNERIYTLAEQAGAIRWNDELNGNSIDFSPEQLEKFAELIVRECANFSYRYTSNQKNVREYNEVGWDCLPGDLLNAMQEHFGVEE